MKGLYLVSEISGLPLRKSLSYLIDVVCCQNCECADGADETGGGGEAVQRAADSAAPHSSSRLLPAQTCPEDTQVPPTLTGINILYVVVLPTHT